MRLCCIAVVACCVLGLSNAHADAIDDLLSAAAAEPARRLAGVWTPIEIVMTLAPAQELSLTARGFKVEVYWERGRARARIVKVRSTDVPDRPIGDFPPYWPGTTTDAPEQ